MSEAEKMCEEIDAALFSGDTFLDAESLSLLDGYLKRWNRWMEEHRGMYEIGT